jgi:hypothetical protein
MWDIAGERVDVRVSENCGPYIMIEPTRIDEVESLFKTNGIPYTLADEAHRCLGTPEAAVFEFGEGADVTRIQRLLDGAS